MNLKKGDLVYIRIDRLPAIVRDFQNEDMLEEAELVECLAHDGVPLKIKECDDGRGVTAVHSGVEFLLYVEEIMKYESTMRRF